jgi:hypothetical protein
MRYKVGDKVRIKSKEWYEKNKDKYGNVNIPLLFNYKMSYYCGEITKITKIEKDKYYRIYLDGERWVWSDEMFDENYKDMGERNVKISIETARKWYNSEDDSLKGIALQAFSEEELSETEVKVWDDLLKLKNKSRGAWIGDSSFLHCNCRIMENTDKNIFVDSKHAKSALAMAQISQLMPYYGGRITDEEWLDDNLKYVLRRNANVIEMILYAKVYHFLAFHTEEQRDEFLKNNEQLVKEYLMLD